MLNLTERQAEIIEKSMKIIAEHGIQDFTTKNLAKEMGFSEAAIYKHFPGKVEIILTLLSLFESQTDEMIKRAVVSVDPGFKEIEAFFKDRISMFVPKPYYAKVIFSEEIFQNDARFTEKIKSIMQKHRKLLGGMIKNLLAKGEIPACYHEEELALILMGSFRLLVTQWRMSQYGFKLEEKFEALFNTLKKMFEHKIGGANEA